MSTWIPEVSFMSEEHELLLRFLRLYKQEMAYRRAAVLVLQMAAQQGRSEFVKQIVVDIEANREACLRDIDVLFRPLESALASGSAYRPILQSLLDKLK